MPDIDTRDQAHVAPVDDVVRVVAICAALAWPVPQSDVPALIDRLGWRAAPPLLDNHFGADTTWPVNRSDVDLACDRGELTEFDFTVTDVVRADHPWRAEFMNDAFADVVSAVTTALGRPSKREQGAEPSARWDLDNGGRVTVLRIPSSVSVSVISKEWADVNRRMGD